jgi:5-methylcytosine-specific restriction enzyme A
MAERLPDGITREHLLAAIDDLDHNASHTFGKSVSWDVLFEGRRYAPKAVVGLAATQVTGRPYGPYDFKRGVSTICFRILRENHFDIVAKADFIPLPEEVHKEDEHIEGAVVAIIINRYEREDQARKKCIAHHGCKCLVCGFDFEAVYGPVGTGYIHVHHIVPLSAIKESYVVDPVTDLVPVCPNCHAIIHRKTPPYLIEEVRALRMRSLPPPVR